MDPDLETFEGKSGEYEKTSFVELADPSWRNLGMRRREFQSTLARTECDIAQRNPYFLHRILLLASRVDRLWLPLGNL
jgi:hypothetical protein